MTECIYYYTCDHCGKETPHRLVAKTFEGWVLACNICNHIKHSPWFKPS